MGKVTARGSDSSLGRGRTTYHKAIITLHINSMPCKLSKVNVTGESEHNLNIAMSPFIHHYHNFFIGSFTPYNSCSLLIKKLHTKSSNLIEVYTKMEK